MIRYSFDNGKVSVTTPPTKPGRSTNIRGLPREELRDEIAARMYPEGASPTQRARIGTVLRYMEEGTR